MFDFIHFSCIKILIDFKNNFFLLGISSIAQNLNVAEKMQQFQPGTCEEYSFSDDGSVEFLKKTKNFTPMAEVKFWEMVPHSEGYI